MESSPRWKLSREFHRRDSQPFMLLVASGGYWWNLSPLAGQKRQFGTQLKFAHSGRRLWRLGDAVLSALIEVCATQQKQGTTADQLISTDRREVAQRHHANGNIA